MNKNPKEKTAWITVRAKFKDKEKIKKTAKHSGLSVVYTYFTAVVLFNLTAAIELLKITKEAG